MAELLRDVDYPASLIDGDREDAKLLIEAAVPEILIVDLRMGSEGLSGLEILRWQQGHPTLCRVPTIVCTADLWGLKGAREELDTMRNVTVLEKPFSVDDLYAKLEAASSV